MSQQIERAISGAPTGTEPRPEIYLDSLHLVLHLVDRLAFASLDLDGRQLYMNALLHEMASRAPDVELEAGYNEVQLRFGKFRQLVHNENESLPGTLFWG